MLVDAVEWLGHSGFRIRAGRTAIYIDPYRVDGGPEADLILITHGHYDHFSPQDVERLAGEHTELVAPAAVAERLSGRVHSIAPGETFEPGSVRGVDVRAVAHQAEAGRPAGPGDKRIAGPAGELSVSVGDEVIYGKYGGTDIEVAGDEVKILRESDILAKVID